MSGAAPDATVAGNVAAATPAEPTPAAPTPGTSAPDTNGADLSLDQVVAAWPAIVAVLSRQPVIKPLIVTPAGRARRCHRHARVSRGAGVPARDRGTEEGQHRGRHPRGHGS